MRRRRSANRLRATRRFETRATVATGWRRGPSTVIAVACSNRLRPERGEHCGDCGYGRCFNPWLLESAMATRRGYVNQLRLGLTSTHDLTAVGGSPRHRDDLAAPTGAAHPVRRSTSERRKSAYRAFHNECGHVPESEKRQVYAVYGNRGHASGQYEVDHFDPARTRRQQQHPQTCGREPGD